MKNIRQLLIFLAIPLSFVMIHAVVVLVSRLVLQQLKPKGTYVTWDTETYYILGFGSLQWLLIGLFISCIGMLVVLFNQWLKAFIEHFFVTVNE